MTMAGYHRNLGVIRTASIKAGIGFRNFFNVIPYGGWDDVSEGRARRQIFTSLVYGAKGVLHFTFCIMENRKRT